MKQKSPNLDIEKSKRGGNPLIDILPLHWRRRREGNERISRGTDQEGRYPNHGDPLPGQTPRDPLERQPGGAIETWGGWC